MSKIGLKEQRRTDHIDLKITSKEGPGDRQVKNKVNERSGTVRTGIKSENARGTANRAISSENFNDKDAGAEKQRADIVTGTKRDVGQKIILGQNAGKRVKDKDITAKSPQSGGGVGRGGGNTNNSRAQIGRNESWHENTGENKNRGKSGVSLFGNMSGNPSYLPSISFASTVVSNESQNVGMVGDMKNEKELKGIVGHFNKTNSQNNKIFNEFYGENGNQDPGEVSDAYIETTDISSTISIPLCLKSQSPRMMEQKQDEQEEKQNINMRQGKILKNYGSNIDQEKEKGKDDEKTSEDNNLQSDEMVIITDGSEDIPPTIQLPPSSGSTPFSFQSMIGGAGESGSQKSGAGSPVQPIKLKMEQEREYIEAFLRDMQTQEQQSKGNFIKKEEKNIENKSKDKGRSEVINDIPLNTQQQPTSQTSFQSNEAIKINKSNASEGNNGKGINILSSPQITVEQIRSPLFIESGEANETVKIIKPSSADKGIRGSPSSVRSSFESTHSIGPSLLSSRSATSVSGASNSSYTSNTNRISTSISQSFSESESGSSRQNVSKCGHVLSGKDTKFNKINENQNSFGDQQEKDNDNDWREKIDEFKLNQPNPQSSSHNQGNRGGSHSFGQGAQQPQPVGPQQGIDEWRRNPTHTPTSATATMRSRTNLKQKGGKYEDIQVFDVKQAVMQVAKPKTAEMVNRRKKEGGNIIYEKNNLRKGNINTTQVRQFSPQKNMKFKEKLNDLQNREENKYFQTKSNEQSLESLRRGKGNLNRINSAGQRQFAIFPSSPLQLTATGRALSEEQDERMSNLNKNQTNEQQTDEKVIVKEAWVEEEQDDGEKVNYEENSNFKNQSIINQGGKRSRSRSIGDEREDSSSSPNFIDFQIRVNFHKPVTQSQSYIRDRKDAELKICIGNSIPHKGINNNQDAKEIEVDEIGMKIENDRQESSTHKQYDDNQINQHININQRSIQSNELSNEIEQNIRNQNLNDKLFTHENQDKDKGQYEIQPDEKNNEEREKNRKLRQQQKSKVVIRSFGESANSSEQEHQNQSNHHHEHEQHRHHHRHKHSHSRKHSHNESTQVHPKQK